MITFIRSAKASTDNRVSIESGCVLLDTGVISHGDKNTTTSVVYPMLDRAFARWQLQSVSLDDAVMGQYAIIQLDKHSIPWVGDDGVTFLDGWDATGKHITGTDALDALGIDVDMSKGGYKLSKRISRMLGCALKGQWFFDTKGLVTIQEDNSLGNQWDGELAIHPDTLKDIVHAYNLDKTLVDESVFYVTIMTEEGQYKGHMVKWDGAPKDVFYTHGGAAKKEVWLKPGTVKYVHINPVHGKEKLKLDIQSVINLHEFLDPQRIFEEFMNEGNRLLGTIVDGSYTMKGAKPDEDDWFLAKYFGAGGKANWFPGIVRIIGRQFEKMMDAGANGIKPRFPFPGYRAYLKTGTIGLVEPGFGKMMLDKASFVIADEDWDEIAGVLGGADKDDAVCVVPFIENGEPFFLIWRQPNGRGEYVVLKAEWSVDHIEAIQGDTSKLPPRVDKTGHITIPLPAGKARNVPSRFEPLSFIPDIRRALDTIGNLGRVINMQMAEAYEGLPFSACSYSQESIIDATVKDGVDSTPAVRQMEKRMIELYGDGQRPVSPFIYKRIKSALGDREVPMTNNSWLDVMMHQCNMYLLSFVERVKGIAANVTPPAGIIEAGAPFLEQGKAARIVWSKNVRNSEGSATTEILDNARAMVMDSLATPEQLAGLIAYINTTDSPERDGVLWAIAQDERGEDMLLKVVKMAGEKETRRITIKSAWWHYAVAKGWAVEGTFAPKAVEVRAKEEVSTMAAKIAGLVIAADKGTVKSVRKNVNMGTCDDKRAFEGTIIAASASNGVIYATLAV